MLKLHEAFGTAHIEHGHAAPCPALAFRFAALLARCDKGLQGIQDSGACRACSKKRRPKPPADIPMQQAEPLSHAAMPAYTILALKHCH